MCGRDWRCEEKTPNFAPLCLNRKFEIIVRFMSEHNDFHCSWMNVWAQWKLRTTELDVNKDSITRKSWTRSDCHDLLLRHNVQGLWNRPAQKSLPRTQEPSHYLQNTTMLKWISSLQAWSTREKGNDVMRCFEARAAMPIVLLLWVSVLDEATIDLKNRPVVWAGHSLLDVQKELGRDINETDATEDAYWAI